MNQSEQNTNGAPASTAPASTSTAPAIDAGAQYVVHLTEIVEVLGERLYPGREYRLRGDILIPIQASVQDATQLR
jgi:hypothetical protein